MKSLGIAWKQLLLCLCCLTIVLSSCGKIQSKQNQESKNDMGLQKWLERIDQGNLAEWQGWSPTWKLADIQAQLNKSGEQQGYTLGAQALSLHRFTLPNQTQALQVFADSEGNISLLRLEDAILTQNANDLERLWGPPKAKNILESNSKFAPSMQWIFPDRGITLYVMNPESKGTMSLSAISLYVPTSLEHYRDDLGGNERVYMFED